MNHRHSLLVSSNHPGLDHLVGDKLLQDEGGDVLIILGLDVGKVALDGLEGKAKEVCSDLLEAVHGDSGVASIVQILDITALTLLVMGHYLTPVPRSLTLN